MTMLAALLALLFAQAPDLQAPYPQEPAQRRGDQSQAYRAMREGRLLPLREIERRVVSSMRDAQYIGFDFDSRSGIYTLKFLRDGTVIWVDVDGHSGQILGRTGR